MEPIQGEGGLNFPKDGYLKEVRALCDKYNVLMAVDEIQAGFGRTGYLMAHHHDDVRPDLVILGKSLSGGFLAVSGVVGDDCLMKNIKPGDHGSTYGGNPLAMATSKAAVECLIDEGMIENSREMGKILLDELKTNSSPILKEVRGRGLFVGIEVKKADDVKVNAV